MKDYFKFNLKAEKLLTAWLAFIVLFGVPYVYLIVKIKDFITPQHPSSIFGFYGILIVLVIIAYAVLFYMVKLTIQGVEYKGNALVFDGTFGSFMGKFIGGLLLTIITLGIYSPWFITKIERFFVDHTSYDSNKMEFEGTAGKLFKIMFFATFLPIVALIIVVVIIGIKTGHSDPKSISIYKNLITFIIIIPYIYYLYKWMVNVKFRNYTISWETTFWNSIGKILLEIFLSIITVGIYYPYARLRLYKYFMDRTVAESETGKKGFGYEIEARKDFLFLWGQLLLTIITMGIYYPWACCKVTSRILSKTYTEQIVKVI